MTAPADRRARETLRTGRLPPVRHRPAAWFSWRRVTAMILRYAFVFRRSWPRLLELIYWPVMNMVVWGLITAFFVQHSSWVAQAIGVLITSVLLWDVLFRSNLGVALSFIEDMWARNLGQLFVSPLRPYELIVAIMIMGGLRTLVAVVPAALLAAPLYDVWVFRMGPPLLAFFVHLLVMGWWVGLMVSALVLRYGLGAESLCWLVLFLLAPVSCIYYPVATLPGWLQPVAWALPAAHVFEGMRAVLFDGGFRIDLFFGAMLLNVLYMALACAFFLFMFRLARRKGLLLRQGE
jgi:ABC-2 type transport system permease protein